MSQPSAVARPRAHVRASVTALAGAALGTVLLVAGCSSSPADPSAAPAGSCAAPSISVEPRAVAPGESIMITGEGFTSGCADAPGEDAGVPLADLDVVLDVDGTPYSVGTADAGPSGTLSFTVAVPLDLPSGQADVTVGSSEPETITVSPLPTTDD